MDSLHGLNAATMQQHVAEKQKSSTFVRFGYKGESIIKPKNMLRTQNLYNRNVGNKPHNIITGARLLIQSTRTLPPPKMRRDCHILVLYVHGMSRSLVEKKDWCRYAYID